jgi:hypothetical protein
MKRYLIRLDRIAGELNAWLLAMAIGLAVFDLTVLAAKCLPPPPPTPMAADAKASGHSVAQPVPSNTTAPRS